VFGDDGHRLSAFFQVTPTFYPDDTSLGFALLAAYHYW
jgi:hypothetical protein